MPTTAEKTEKTETNENKKDELLLDSLEIKGYRCFEHLTIEKLGRVNLIVGKNSVGKSTLLESVYLFASNFQDSYLSELLDLRDEPIWFSRVENGKVEYIYDIKHLFFNKPETEDNEQILSIGNLKNPKKTIEAYIEWFEKSPEQKRLGKAEIYESHEPYLYVKRNDKLIYSHILSESFKTPNVYITIESEVLKNKFVPASGLSLLALASYWDKMSLSDLEIKAIEALKIISPEVEKLNFIQAIGKNVRLPFVKTSKFSEPSSLKSLGDGMTRILGIILSLVNCKDGILLIDEIENGLHYSILPDVWKLIFKTAKDLNVQVFATTHSKDCIEAFTQAAIDDEESDGMLIRLENKDGKIRAVNFNEDELETVERRNIEVR